MIKQLRIKYWTELLIVLATVVLFELPFSNAVRGFYANYANAEFILTCVMELVTIISLPVILKMLKSKRVKSYLDVEDNVGRLTAILRTRMLLLYVLMEINVVLYYLFMQTTFGYMAIIQAVCLVFAYPYPYFREDENKEIK